MARPFMQMRLLVSLIVLATSAFCQTSSPQLPADDAVRIREFYRLAGQVQDQIWPGWSSIPAPLLLITPEREFLTHHPAPPKDFVKIGDGFYARPRQFPTSLLATFPAFGPPSVIVIGEPKNTSSKTSTPWLITLMHEHFHQLQTAQSGYFGAVQALGLSHGDTTGMWMLNYPFPYDRPEVISAFDRLRTRLLAALSEPDSARAAALAKDYAREREKFFGLLSADDRKYLNFQLWQEGIARYTQVKAAEAAAHYQPTSNYAALPDFESFAGYAAKARTETLDELKQADLREWKRTVVYPLGAAEGMLLDRVNPRWKESYFKHPLTLETLFQDVPSAATP